MSSHFLHELNSATGFSKKLGITLILLVFGILVGPLLWMGVKFAEGPVWRPVVTIGVDTIAMFYVTLLVYVWWRPALLRHFYQSLELKLVAFGYILNLAVLIMLLIGAIYGVIEFLHGP